MCLYRSGRVSMSHELITLKSISPSPADSTPMSDGLNSASGASNRSAPTLITRPSGSVYLRDEGPGWRVRIAHTGRGDAGAVR